MSEVLLSLKDIRASYEGEPVLRGVSCDVEAGTLLGIRGENGAGKSTLMAIMAGVLKPDSGQRIASPGLDGGVCYVPQDIALYPTLTGRQNLSFWAEVYGMRGKPKAARIRYLLKLMELEDKGRKRVETYSGGMKRRLNMAAALVVTPKLLLLDEPTVGADAHSVEVMLDSVKRMRDKGTAVVLISHMAGELEGVCDRIITLKAGVIAEDTRKGKAE